jgi:PAS domain S-box-containing protein
MNFQDRSKEELLNDVIELQKKYNSLEELYQKKINESLQTRKTLHENEANIKAIIENSLESIWSIDTNYKIQYINKVFCTAFKQSFGIELAKGVNILEALPPNLQPIWKERYDRAFNGEHFVFTDKIELDRGSIYVEVAMYPIIIDGKVVGASFFGKDITQRMLSKEALLESETRFKALHNASFGGIVIHDKGKILECNQVLSSMTGYSVDELIGIDGMFLIAEDSRDFVKTKIESGEEKPYEAKALRKNGEEYPVRLEGKNIPYKGKIARATEFRDITEQKEAESKLKSSEERLKILFNYAPEAYYLIDLSGTFIDGNIAAEKLVGYSKEEIIGKNLSELNLLCEKQLEKAGKHLSDSKMGKPSGPDEFVFTRKNGSKVTVEITTHPVKIEGETLVLGIARDISGRKSVEKAMREAVENWNRTFQAMHSGIALLDINQKIIQTNKAFQSFLNAGEEELVNQFWFPLISGGSFLNEKNPFERMKISLACETIELTIHHKTVEILVDPIVDENKQITGAVLILNDISQRKRDENIQQILHEIAGTSMDEKTIEELLVIVREQLSKVIDTKNFFVALYQPENDTLRKVIFEDEKDDFVEWEAGISLSGQVLKLKKPLLLSSRDESRFAAENNIELLGSPAACWLGVPLLNGDNAIGVLVVQSYDDENAYDQSTIRLLILIAHELSVIIERKKMIQDLVAAKERAEESDRLKSAFLANMSHEIRTPMNGILGFAELLKEPKLSGEEQQMFIDIIEKSGERMLNIINDLINISKIESGQMDIHFSDININEQLQFLFNFFKLEARQKNLKLIVSCPLSDEQAKLHSDKEKIYAILTNLVKNAIKFTKNGTIEFGYYAEKEKVVFYIKDTGIGIPENKQKKIFERFVQASSGMSSVYEGAGLGLAISKAYVEMLGGKIWIESEQGIGTCFYFTIPIKNEQDSEFEKEEELTVTNEKTRSGNTILIAEDDETSLVYLKHLLKNTGLEILVAKTGGEAVELCRSKKHVSLVLMDINMPVCDGDIAAQIIKNFNPNLPIIAQTAFALDEDKEKYKETFDDYITKPINAEELKQKVKKYLMFSEG